ncbi:MAG: ABC transporter permease, partial [Betaproteobacteria bacterium]
SAAALSLAAAIAIPAGIAAARQPRFALAAISSANIGRTLPSLAVLALVMPILGTGFAPSLFALTLLALPPILLNTIAGLRGVDPDVVDAARGMGMSTRTILQTIELPLAMPVMFAGLRTAAVQVISGAVLAAFIGGGGLGDFITAGIAMMAWPQILVGAIPVTLLSLCTDFAFGRLQRRLTPAGLRAA